MAEKDDVVNKNYSYNPVKRGYTPTHGGTQGTYQPTADTIPSNPPSGGSGVPPKKTK